MTDVIQNWRSYSPKIFPLPHSSWRNRSWLKKNFWFERELIPVLRHKVRGILQNEKA
jgi:uracil-DNA glycosylase